MPILYAVITRAGGTSPAVLVKYASCAGNFVEVTEQILQKIPPENGKMTYSHGSYLFHYILEDRLIYMCITDDDFERARAFLFLNDIKQRFQTQYGVRAHTALPFAMNSEFSRVLCNQMKYFSDSKDVDVVSRVEGEIDELKDIMVRNIDNIAARGERLELLIHKTENLNASSVQFRKTSRNLQRSLFWKNIKLMVIIGVVVIVILYFIVSMACGGLNWNTCV